MEIKLESPKILLSTTLLVTFLSLALTQASAQVLYDNGAPALGSPNGVGFYADTNSPVETEVGDVFTAPTSGTAAVINFSGIYYGYGAPGTLTPTTTDSFLISLYALAPGAAPSTADTPITSTVSDLTRTFLGLGNSKYIFSFSGVLDTPLTLTAGSTYYLGISDTTSPYEDFAVSATATPTSSTGYAIPAGATDFGAEGSAPLSFSLATPEPKAWALGIMGIIALCVAGSRLRRTL